MKLLRIIRACSWPEDCASRHNETPHRSHVDTGGKRIVRLTVFRLLRLCARHSADVFITTRNAACYTTGLSPHQYTGMFISLIAVPRLLKAKTAHSAPTRKTFRNLFENTKKDHPTSTASFSNKSVMSFQLYARWLVLQNAESALPAIQDGDL